MSPVADDGAASEAARATKPIDDVPVNKYMRGKVLVEAVCCEQTTSATFGAGRGDVANSILVDGAHVSRLLLPVGAGVLHDAECVYPEISEPENTRHVHGVLECLIELGELLCAQLRLILPECN